VGRKSSVERLDPEIQDLVARLFLRGRTLDEIMEALRPLDADVSRSGLHRYLKSQAQLGERLRHVRAVSSVMYERDGETSLSQIATVNNALAQSFLFGLMEKAQEAEEAGEAAEGEKDRPVTIASSAKEVLAVAKGLDHLASAARKNQDYLEKAEQRGEARGRRKALEEVAEKVDSSAREAGLSAKAAAQLRRDLLGLRTPASKS